MKARGRRLRRAVGAALVAVAAGVALPVWEIWIIDKTRGVLDVGQRPLWVWARQPSDERRRFNRVLEDNAHTGAILIGLATTIGMGVYWIGPRPPRAEPDEDYRDGPGGIVPDGRLIRPAG